MTKEIIGSIWTVHEEKAGSWAVIPINQMYKAEGDLVMGKGLALSAANRYPELPKLWGKTADQSRPLKLDPKNRLVGFPTKKDWRDNASLFLIRQGLRDLRLFSIDMNQPLFLIPRLGCGLGNLDWNKVRPVIEAEMAGHKFMFVYQ